jgi:hypothetical protein
MAAITLRLREKRKFNFLVLGLLLVAVVITAFNYLPF